MVVILALLPQLKRYPDQQFQIWIAFGALAFAFLVPLLAYHFFGWRNVPVFAD